MDEPINSIDQILKEKNLRRRERAALPFPEKIKILIELQRRRAPIVLLRGKVQRIWHSDSD